MFTVPFAVLAKDVRGSFSGIDNFMDFFPVWRLLLSFESKTKLGTLFLQLSFRTRGLYCQLRSDKIKAKFVVFNEPKFIDLWRLALQDSRFVCQGGWWVDIHGLGWNSGCDS